MALKQNLDSQHERLAGSDAPGSMIRGLIFDCDGLIIDTEGPAYQSWQEIYTEHGCTLPLEEWARCLGGLGDEFDPCSYLEGKINQRIDHDVIRARRLARKRELVALEHALPGVLDYLSDARNLHLKLAVASSSRRKWVTEQLSRLEIFEQFDAIICAEDVQRVKPHPDIYRRALSLLGLEPQEAIVFEDSPNGITAARAAGIFCVVVPNPLTSRLPIDHADLRLTSLADMSLLSLIGSLVESAVPGQHDR